MEAAAAANHPIKAAVFIKTSVDVTWQRWAASEQIGDRGERFDDDKEKLATRLEEFKSKTEPVLDVYRAKGLLIEVDGNPDKQAVFDQITAKLEELANA